MVHSVSLLTDIALGIIFAVLASHVARLLKQPLILGYVLGGLALGENLGFGLVTNPESIELISEIGLILLLFIIGLEINLRELAKMGKAMFTLGAVQFIGCVALGLAFFKPLGYAMGGGKFDLLYVAVALALSSTLIAVKLLHDKFEIQTVAGKLTLGILILQDMWAIVFMAFQPNLLNPRPDGILRSLVLGGALVLSAFLASRYVLGALFQAAGKQPELVLLTAVAWCFGLCGLADYAGLSKEMGALIAGMSVAAFPYGADVSAKVGGVRDFFVTLFFVSLGLKVPKPTAEVLGGAALMAAFVAFSRFATIVPASRALGQGLRAGAITALNISQISEFSLVILALGVGYGHISPGLQSVVLIAMIATSVMATYLILFNHALASAFIRGLDLIGIKNPDGDHAGQAKAGHDGNGGRDIVLLGCFRVGMAFLDEVKKTAPQLAGRILVVDYNPSLKTELEERGFAWAYGDLSHPETLQHLGIGSAEVVICSISDTFLKGTTNYRLLRHLKHLSPKARIILSANDPSEASKLMKHGAYDVLLANTLGGIHLAGLLQKAVS